MLVRLEFYVSLDMKVLQGDQKSFLEVRIGNGLMKRIIKKLVMVFLFSGESRDSSKIIFSLCHIQFTHVKRMDTQKRLRLTRNQLKARRMELMTMLRKRESC